MKHHHYYNNIRKLKKKELNSKIKLAKKIILIILKLKMSAIIIQSKAHLNKIMKISIKINKLIFQQRFKLLLVKLKTNKIYLKISNRAMKYNRKKLLINKFQKIRIIMGRKNILIKRILQIKKLFKINLL